jgi:hypothetical protein
MLAGYEDRLTLVNAPGAVRGAVLGALGFYGDEATASRKAQDSPSHMMVMLRYFLSR